MFDAFIFQDALRFGVIDEDAMISLAKAIGNHEWDELEAWLETHHDLLIQHYKAEAPDLSVRSAPFLVLRETPPEGRNDGDEASSSASSPILCWKPSPCGNKWG